MRAKKGGRREGREEPSERGADSGGEAARPSARDAVHENRELQGQWSQRLRPPRRRFLRCLHHLCVRARACALYSRASTHNLCVRAQPLRVCACAVGAGKHRAPPARARLRACVRACLGVPPSTTALLPPRVPYHDRPHPLRSFPFPSRCSHVGWRVSRWDIQPLGRALERSAACGPEWAGGRAAPSRRAALARR